MATLTKSSETMKLIYPKETNTRPHVATQYNDNALNNVAGASSKNIFLLGSATEGNPDNIYEIKSSSQARAIFGSGDLVEAMELIWNPTGSYYQNGGTIYAQRVENATQAQLVKGPLTFTSTVYGASANKVSVSFNKNPVSGAYDFHVDYEPKMYSQTYMSIGNLFTIGYDPTSPSVTGASYKITGDLSGAQTFEIALNTSSSTTQTVLTMDLTSTAYNNIGKVITAISSLPGFSVTTLKSCANIDSTTLDLTSGSGYLTLGTSASPTTITDFYGDLLYTTRYDDYVGISVNRLGAPTGVTAKTSGSDTVVTANAQEIDFVPFDATNLSGGSDGNVPVSWADKFQNVHGVNAYYIVPLTSEENIHAELKEFLNEEEILGYNYFGWVGGGFNESMNTAINRQTFLKSDRIALVANSGYYNSLSGKVVHAPAYLMAAYVAGVASSLSVGDAVTHKYLELTSLDQNFNGDELNALDDNGVIAIEKVVNRNQSGGYRIVEDVTTYNSTNEPVKNLVSLREITDYLFDDLRIYLEDTFIGSSVVNTTGSLIASFIEAFLKQKVSEGLLASYDRQSITCTIDGNSAYVAFSAAPTREVRTILVSGTYTNFTSTTSQDNSTYITNNGVTD